MIPKSLKSASISSIFRRCSGVSNGTWPWPKDLTPVVRHRREDTFPLPLGQPPEWSDLDWERRGVRKRSPKAPAVQPLSRARLDPTWVSQYLNHGPTAPRTIPAASAVGPVSSRYARPHRTRVHASYTSETRAISIAHGTDCTWCTIYANAYATLRGTYVASARKWSSLILTLWKKEPAYTVTRAALRSLREPFVSPWRKEFPHDRHPIQCPPADRRQRLAPDADIRKYSVKSQVGGISNG